MYTMFPGQLGVLPTAIYQSGFLDERRGILAAWPPRSTVWHVFVPDLTTSKLYMHERRHRLMGEGRGCAERDGDIRCEVVVRAHQRR